MTINIDNTKALERIAGALESIDKKLESISKSAADRVSFEIAQKTESARATVGVLMDFMKYGKNKEGNADEQ